MKVAILTSRLESFAGSEIVALEVAQFFIERGHDVVVQADKISNDFKQSFNKQIQFRTNELDITDFDFIWSQHGQYLKNIQDTKTLLEWSGVLVSVHLSYYHPTEIFHHPLAIYISRSRVFNADITKDYLEESNTEDIFIFRNAAPLKFHSQPITNKNGLKCILVVSNHLPDELISAIDTLKKNGVIVKIIGKKYVEKIIEPDDFSEVQAVITIGKTVQYALASGKPVYCYDHFGGPGWLHEDNFKKAEYFNFNGSCSKQKSSLDISNEILEDFKEAEKFCRSNWKKLSGRYNLDLYLEDILANSKPNNISKISDIFKIEALQQNCFHTKDKKRLRKFRKVIVILVLLHIVLPIVYLNI